MGKSWKNKPRKEGGGGGGGGGKKGHFHHDFSSCRGFGIILGTSDAAKERETSRELVSLVNDAIERVYPESLKAKEEETVATEQTTSLSIEELMKREISEVKEKKSTRNTTAVSIQTGVKGITLIKLLKKEYCPIVLVKDIFQHIQQEKQAYSKYTIRVIPLKYVFFPNEVEFEESIEQILHQEVGIPLKPKPPKPVKDTENNTEEPPVAEGTVVGEKRSHDEISQSEIKDEQNEEDPSSKVQKVEDIIPVLPPAPLPTKKTRYVILFKARNHNVLKKSFAHDQINSLMVGYGIPDYKHAESLIVVEALKNLCGVSYFTSKDYEEYEEFNLRKFQSKFCENDSRLARQTNTEQLPTSSAVEDDEEEGEAVENVEEDDDDNNDDEEVVEQDRNS
eukprot:gene9214-10002_t